MQKKNLLVKPFSLKNMLNTSNTWNGENALFTSKKLWSLIPLDQGWKRKTTIASEKKSKGFSHRISVRNWYKEVVPLWWVSGGWSSYILMISSHKNTNFVKQFPKIQSLKYHFCYYDFLEYTKYISRKF